MHSRLKYCLLVLDLVLPNFHKLLPNGDFTHTVAAKQLEQNLFPQRFLPLENESFLVV
jgi:hypothetical protein